MTPEGFAKRLHEAMTRAGIAEGRGRGALLAKRHKISGVTANAYLNGTHMPGPEKVLGMARDFEVDFAWLLMGIADPAAQSQSQATRLDPVKLAESIEALRRVAKNIGIAYDPVTHAEATAATYELRCALGAEPSTADVIDFGAKVTERLRKAVGAN